MNFMREKKIINNKSYFDRKRNVKVKLKIKIEGLS